MLPIFSFYRKKELEFSLQKALNIKYHENPSIGSPDDTWGQTEGRTNGHVLVGVFPRLCERAQKKSVKKMVALIILIIALQFDVSTSCNDSLR